MKKILYFNLLLLFILFTSCSSKIYTLKIATGSLASEFYSYAGAISKTINENSTYLDIDIMTSKGSSYSLELLKQKQADLAIIHSNRVMHKEFIDKYDENYYDDFKFVTNLYHGNLYLIANSDIKKFEDLRGKNVAFGKDDSGIDILARYLLNQYGIGFDEINIENLSFENSLENFRQKKIDAFFIVTDELNNAIEDLLHIMKANVVSIRDDIIYDIISKHRFYFRSEIDMNKHGINNKISTIGINTSLIARKELSKETVYNITKTIYQNLDKISEAHSKGIYLNLDEMANLDRDYFHEGALKYFDEIKK